MRRPRDRRQAERSRPPRGSCERRARGQRSRRRRRSRNARSEAGAWSALVCRRTGGRSTSDFAVASKPAAPCRRSASRDGASLSSAPTARTEASAGCSRTRLREVDSERDLFLVAPAPLLARLERAVDAVLGRAEIRHSLQLPAHEPPLVRYRSPVRLWRQLHAHRQSVRRLARRRVGSISLGRPLRAWLACC